MLKTLISQRLVEKLTTVIVILIFTIGGIQISNANEPEFLPVNEAFQLQHSQTGNELSLSWVIAEGYYLYQSRLSATQQKQPITLQLNEVPESKVDEYFGQQSIFKHQLTATALLSNNQDVKVTYQGCAEAGLCYPPVSVTITPKKLTDNASPLEGGTERKVVSNTTNNEIGEITHILNQGSLLWKLAIFFALGLGLAFTPCVFPMVPILSSIIAGQGERLTTQRAFILSLSYVLAMAITYAIAGVIVGYFGAQFNVQLYLQHPWVLGIFSIIFIALALSMFGLYEIRLPRFLQDKLNHAQHQQQGGSVLSVAIMGALSALVVSPCVSAPLAGTLVYISTTGDALLGGSALLALGLGMGTPLLLIGTGGGRLLPKAGVWMNSIKNIFGVALLAVAIWIVERIIPASLTLALWGALLIGCSVYLGAFERQSTGWKQLQRVLGLITFIYGTLLMIGASAGAHNPLSPLASLHNSPAFLSNEKSHSTIKLTDPMVLKQHIQEANANKLVIVDFYADWCISCKVMEEKVFNHPDVISNLSDVIFLQLDITDNSEEQLALLKELGLFGPPAILFFKNNQELYKFRILGDTDDKMFIQSIQQAKQA